MAQPRRLLHDHVGCRFLYEEDRVSLSSSHPLPPAHARPLRGQGLANVVAEKKTKTRTGSTPNHTQLPEISEKKHEDRNFTIRVLHTRRLLPEMGLRFTKNRGCRARRRLTLWRAGIGRFRGPWKINDPNVARREILLGREKVAYSHSTTMHKLTYTHTHTQGRDVAAL